jgi:hypothetical protein
MSTKIIYNKKFCLCCYTIDLIFFIFWIYNLQDIADSWTP